MKQLSERDLNIQLVGLPALFFGYILLFLVPYHSQADSVLTIHHYYLWLAVFLAVGVMASIVYLLKCSLQKRRTGILLPLLVLGSPIVGCSGLVILAASLTPTASVTDEKGSEFVLLASHFMQGSQLMIARKASGNIFQTNYEILVDSPWEEEWGYLKVVLPPEAPDGMNLYLTPNHLLVGIPYKNEAFLAYDLENNIAYSDDDCEDSQSNPCKPISKLSPKILISP